MRTRRITAGEYRDLLGIIRPETVGGVYGLIFAEATGEVRFWLRFYRLLWRGPEPRGWKEPDGWRADVFMPPEFPAVFRR